MPTMKPCPTCGHMVAVSAERCPSCGADVRPQIVHVINLVVGIASIAILVYMLTKVAALRSMLSGLF